MTKKTWDFIWCETY